MEMRRMWWFSFGALRNAQTSGAQVRETAEFSVGSIFFLFKVWLFYFVQSGNHTHTHKLRKVRKTHKQSHFEVKASHNWEPLHCQLLGGLLVTMATAAFDFGTAPQVLRSCESAAQVYMPWVLTWSSYKIKLYKCSEFIIYLAETLSKWDYGHVCTVASAIIRVNQGVVQL